MDETILIITIMNIAITSSSPLYNRSLPPSPASHLQEIIDLLSFLIELFTTSRIIKRSLFFV